MNVIKKSGKLKWSMQFFHPFNFALKAENDLPVFVSHVRLFQMHNPLYAKLFFPSMSSTGEYEDLILSYVAPYFEYQTTYEIILLDI